jgi:hypothetical protein
MRIQDQEACFRHQHQLNRPSGQDPPFQHPLVRHHQIHHIHTQCPIPYTHLKTQQTNFTPLHRETHHQAQCLLRPEHSLIPCANAKGNGTDVNENTPQRNTENVDASEIGSKGNVRGIGICSNSRRRDCFARGKEMFRERRSERLFLWGRR